MRKSLTLPYIRYQITPSGSGRREFVYRPVVRILVLKGKKSVPFCALVDSGADETSFPGWVAEELDIEVHGGKKCVFKGIGGSNVAFGHSVRLLVEEKFPFVCPVYFSDEWNDMPFGILGERSFFSRFSIKFNYPRNLEIMSRSW